MQIYLVGGALRDRLLGLPPHEQDYVVVGATPEQMLDVGYQQVGRDFPIFLHPDTHEQYALARTQRTSREESPGRQAYADPSVTIEEDLARRDLTINAMAEAADGTLVDPFGGQQDLQEKWLRHVSPAFVEDPVRVLRVARFMARYQPLGFRVAPETLSLMRDMGNAGRLDALVPERVWQELTGALTCDDPEPFFTTLRHCGALTHILPELERLWGVPQPRYWHPEVDCGVHTMLALKVACGLTPSLEVRFAVLTHDLGKGTTPSAILPSHHGHEHRGVKLVRLLCERLRAPKRFTVLAKRCALYHGQSHRLAELKPQTVLKVLQGLDAFRQAESLTQYLLVCEADYRGRKGFEDRPYPQARQFRRLFEAASRVDSSELQPLAQGKAVGEALHRLRLQAIKTEQRRMGL